MAGTVYFSSRSAMVSPSTFLLLFLGLGTAAAQSCGGSYSVPVGQVGQLISPDYPYSYRGPLDCAWNFVAPAGYNVRISCDMWISCAADYVAVSKTGDNTFRDGQKFCGSGTLTANSTTNALSISLHADAVQGQGSLRCYVDAVVSSTAAPAPAPAPAPVSSNSTTNSTCECGIKNGNRIVGGTATAANEWPWQVALYKKSSTGVRYQFCGGTLISPEWILTASHCVDGEVASSISVGLGLDYKDQTSAPGAVLRQASLIKMHASYDANTVNNDIALIKLAQPVNYTSNVRPACLPYNYTTKNWSGSTATVTGWGTTSFGGIDSNKLLEVTLPVLNTTDCQKYLGSNVNNNMICTYTAGKDSCQGDSGGPLNYQDPATGRVTIIGIVSWGVGCASVNRPGVYTKLTNYLGWIEQQTGATFCKP